MWTSQARSVTLIRGARNLKQIYPDIIYIGSHIHNYQKGVVTFNNKNILQYITGTGGAFLDEIPIENNFTEGNTTYSIINKSKKHGYILISNINIIFKQIKQF